MFYFQNLEFIDEFFLDTIRYNKNYLKINNNILNVQNNFVVNILFEKLLEIHQLGYHLKQTQLKIS